MLFLTVLIAVAVILFRQLQFFVGAFLGAVTIYVVLRNVMFRMTEKHGMRHWRAALLLVAATALLLTGFGWLSVKAVGSGVENFHVDELLKSLNSVAGRIEERLDLDILPDNVVNKSDGTLKKLAGGVLNATYSFAANLFMMLIVLYFMLTRGRQMETHLWQYVPFRDNSLTMIKHELKTMIYSNAVGMPVILVLQALVSTLIYWLLGFDNPWFWGFITALCGLLPLLGTAFVYVPVSIWLLARGDTLAGVVLMIYGLTVISNADNVFRIVLLRKVADTHPLVVIFGVLLGIPMFGFWGIIFGPLFISGFLLLAKIYYMEYGPMEYPCEEELHNRPVRKSVPRHFSQIHRHMCDSAGKGKKDR